MGGPQYHSPHSFSQSQIRLSIHQQLVAAVMPICYDIVFAGLSSSAFTGLFSGGLRSQLSPLGIASAVLLLQQLVGSFASFMVIFWCLDVFTGLSGVVITGLFITLSCC